MEIVQIAVIGLIAMVLAITVKAQKPEISVFISIAAGVIIFAFSFYYLDSVVTVLKRIAENIDPDMSFVNIMLRIVAVAYVCEFSSQLCKDSGESAIASKIELAGKLLILYISAPIVLSLLELFADIV